MNGTLTYCHGCGRKFESTLQFRGHLPKGGYGCPRWRTQRKPRRLRRQFDDEFKAGAVRLVLDEGKTVGRVARDLDLTESALRVWVDRARADRTQGRTRG